MDAVQKRFFLYQDIEATKLAGGRSNYKEQADDGYCSIQQLRPITPYPRVTALDSALSKISQRSSAPFGYQKYFPRPHP